MEGDVSQDRQYEEKKSLHAADLQIHHARQRVSRDMQYGKLVAAKQSIANYNICCLLLTENPFTIIYKLSSIFRCRLLMLYGRGY